MSKINLITIVLILGITMCFACGNRKQSANEKKTPTEEIVKTISFEGGNCSFYELQKNSMFAPANMQEDEKAFMLRLKCSIVSPDAQAREVLSVLYDKGDFVAPDGKRYKAGTSAMIMDSDGGLIYSLIVAVPKSVDVETLRFVYNNQVMSLKN